MKPHWLLLPGTFMLLPLQFAAAAVESLPPFLLDVSTLDENAVSKQAELALTLPISTVVDKEGPSPSGDPHDYVSYGRYWWPDPSGSNGLPFIRRDGHPNREQIALGDRERWWQMVNTVETLAQGWQVFQRERYARRAGEWIRAWFVETDTRMNPSLEYAQIRMGHDGNRGSNWGLIDFRSIVRVIDALRLLYASPAFSGDDRDKVNRWLEGYLQWLIISKNGRLEREAPNNHGSWYLCQVIAIARHLGDEEEARQFAREDFARISNQFAPDGSQPLEMVRVDGLEYCAFNLEAQFQIARLAAPLGVDLWHYEGTNGASLQRGIEFLRSYNVTPESWPHNQLKTLKPGFLQTLLDQADRVWPNAGSDVSRGQPAQPDTGAAVETPATLPGSETHIYRDGTPQPMRLHVFKPKQWQAGDRRPAMLFFFGGGWSRGTPEKSAGWAKYAASLGMVGIAPDYRTRERFGTSPLESVADGRAALRWVQDHVGELGINPAKIVTGGSSAGGHVALWTAIERTPPGSDPKEAPTAKPAAVILFSAVSDTSVLSGYTPHRFGTNAVALSPINQLDVDMPPMLMFHGDSDPTVPYQQALALHARLVATSNVCELITVPGGNHGFTSQLPEWKKRSQEIVENFLASQALMPALAK